MSMEKRSTALVIKSTGSWYVLRDVRSGRPLAGRIRGSLRLRGSRSTNPVVVGDRVEYETADDGTAAIVGVCPRSNYIIRRSPNLSKESHIIAANVDQAFLVVSLYRPATNNEFIDRFLVTAEAYRVPATLVLNKCDLYVTDELRETLRRRGFQWAEVTLYVGYGTFSPVRCEDIRNHQMHREYVELPEETANAIAEAKARHRPVIAVGTTSVRTLEGVAQVCGRAQPFAGWTDIFLYPGRPFRVVDGIITNFHLPESSLLMLVSAFAGRKRILEAYQEAVKEGYRFFSYGDAMLIR